MQQSKELVVGIVALAKEAMALGKDGFQPADALQFVKDVATNEEFRNKMLLAVQGVDQVPAEWSPVTIEKVVEIVAAVVDELRK